MIINNPFSKRKTVRCPDGTTKTVFKSFDDAFPLLVKEHNSKISADIQVQQNATAKISKEYADKIQSFLFSINEDNSSLMMTARNAYAVFQADPCNGMAFLQREIEKINNGQRNMQELRARVTGFIAIAENFKDDPKKIFPYYLDLLNRFGGKFIPEAAKAEIEDSREIAHKWIKGGNNG